MFQLTPLPAVAPLLSPISATTAAPTGELALTFAGLVDASLVALPPLPPRPTPSLIPSATTQSPESPSPFALISTNPVPPDPALPSPSALPPPRQAIAGTGTVLPDIGSTELLQVPDHHGNLVVNNTPVDTITGRQVRVARSIGVADRASLVQPELTLAASDADVLPDTGSTLPKASADDDAPGLSAPSSALPLASPLPLPVTLVPGPLPDVRQQPDAEGDQTTPKDAQVALPVRSPPKIGPVAFAVPLAAAPFATPPSSVGDGVASAPAPAPALVGPGADIGSPLPATVSPRPIANEPAPERSLAETIGLRRSGPAEMLSVQGDWRPPSVAAPLASGFRLAASNAALTPPRLPAAVTIIVPDAEAVSSPQDSQPLPPAAQALATPLSPAAPFILREALSPARAPAASVPTNDSKIGLSSDNAALLRDSAREESPVAPVDRSPVAVPVLNIGTPQPAARAFAAGIAAAGVRAPRLVRDDDQGAGVVTAGPSGVLPTDRADPTDSRQAAIDTRRDDWTRSLIDRIDASRDVANARDTRIRLIPDALGKIDVALRQQGDTLHVHFSAEVPATQALLVDAQPRLTELAEARGLRLGQSSVDAGTPGQASGQGFGAGFGSSPDQRRAPSAPSVARHPSSISTNADTMSVTDQRLA